MFCSLPTYSSSFHLFASISRPIPQPLLHLLLTFPSYVLPPSNPDDSNVASNWADAEAQIQRSISSRNNGKSDNVENKSGAIIPPTVSIKVGERGEKRKGIGVVEEVRKEAGEGRDRKRAKVGSKGKRR